MKIVNAMFGCGLGGIEQALVDYSEALLLCGHEPVAIIHPKADVLRVLRARNIPFYTLPNAGVWDPIAILRLRGILSKINPDICIAHGNRAVGLLTRAAPRRRIVSVMHNYKIRSDHVDNVFYPTQDLLRHVQANGAKDKHLYLVPNMVRVPAEMPLRHWRNPPVIGAMGRFVAKKGFALFIEALALLKSRNIIFSAVLAGDGEEARALRELAAKKGLEGDLRFCGWAQDTKAFFDGVDIFCLPSYHEPFGIVLLEAMAQGLAVVATKSEGPSEILNTTNGVLVEKDNPALLADALAELLSDRLHAEQLAQGAYQSVKSQYDLAVVALKLDLALREISRL